jgi:hypothetical protein
MANCLTEFSRVWAYNPVIGSLASAFMASVENSGSGIARVKKINSAPWVW